MMMQLVVMMMQSLYVPRAGVLGGTDMDEIDAQLVEVLSPIFVALV